MARLKSVGRESFLLTDCPEEEEDCGPMIVAGGYFPPHGRLAVGAPF